jgi:hypothetical protein
MPSSTLSQAKTKSLRSKASKAATKQSKTNQEYIGYCDAIFTCISWGVYLLHDTNHIAYDGMHGLLPWWRSPQVAAATPAIISMIHVACSLAFTALNVYDLVVVKPTMGLEWMLRVIHHTLCCLLMLSGRFDLAIIFLRTHAYILIAIRTQQSWVIELLTLDELWLVYWMIVSPQWTAQFLPHCLGLLYLRPAFLRIALDANGSYSPRVELALVARVVMQVVVTVAVTNLTVSYS